MRDFFVVVCLFRIVYLRKKNPFLINKNGNPEIKKIQAHTHKTMPLFGSAKVKPFIELEEKNDETKTFVEMRVIRLRTFMKLYGGQRHPRLESYKELVERGELTSTKYMFHQNLHLSISPMKM